MTPLAPYIDHTLLKPDSTRVQVEKLCLEARQHGFFAVCVNPIFVELCKKWLAGSSVQVATVVGFPLGANTTATKVFEAQEAVLNGADEIDMVLPLGAAKDHRWEEVQKDIQSVVQAVPKNIVKVILETSLLTEEEKVQSCLAAVAAKAHFVKTSTGFGGGGASVLDIQLMKRTVGEQAKIKASGGIKDEAMARALIQAGAARLGTSSGVALVTGVSASGSY